MSDTPVTYDVADGVAWITLNRPRVLNALNPAAEEELRRSEERFRALIENSSDAIALLDSDAWPGTRRTTCVSSPRRPTASDRSTAPRPKRAGSMASAATRASPTPSACRISGASR